jgi:hypothetical protein
VVVRKKVRTRAVRSETKRSRRVICGKRLRVVSIDNRESEGSSRNRLALRSKLGLDKVRLARRSVKDGQNGVKMVEFYIHLAYSVYKTRSRDHLKSRLYAIQNPKIAFAS